MSRILVVGPYPPRRCGIGAYAAAHAERLAKRGDEVTVLSPLDGNGDVRVAFRDGEPFRTAARLAPRFDRILVHFQPALYYRPRAAVSKVRTSLGLLRLVRAHRGVEILVHEADRPVPWRPDYVLLRMAFRAAPLLLFHTDRERRQLEQAYRVRVRARLVDHREGIPVRQRLSKEEARERLGIPQDRSVFVSPGFLHPDKGLERAIEAVRASGAGTLYIVGSVQEPPTPRASDYAARLRTLTGDDVILVERFVDEAELDTWTAAADAVVLPYRRSWSSGALARAQALGTPAIVTAVGGLPEQATERDVIVEDDRALARALLRFARNGVRT